MLEVQAMQFGRTLVDTLNPVLPGLPSTDKLIRLFVIAYTGVFLYRLIQGFGSILDSFQDLGAYPIFTIEYLSMYVIHALGVFWFWQRKEWGWMLLVFFVLYSGCASLIGFSQWLTWKSSDLLGELFPVPPVIPSLLWLGFWVASMLVLCRRDIMVVFKINKEKTMNTFLISGMVMVFLIYYYARQ